MRLLETEYPPILQQDQIFEQPNKPTFSHDSFILLIE